MIGPDENFCSKTNNIPLRVEFYHNVSPDNRGQITPAIRVLPKWLKPLWRKDLWRVTEFTLTVVCPPRSGAASSDQGQDPGPDKPISVE